MVVALTDLERRLGILTDHIKPADQRLQEINEAIRYSQVVPPPGAFGKIQSEIEASVVVYYSSLTRVSDNPATSVS